MKNISWWNIISIILGIYCIKIQIKVLYRNIHILKNVLKKEWKVFFCWKIYQWTLRVNYLLVKFTVNLREIFKIYPKVSLVSKVLFLLINRLEKHWKEKKAFINTNTTNKAKLLSVCSNDKKLWNTITNNCSYQFCNPDKKCATVPRNPITEFISIR